MEERADTVKSPETMEGEDFLDMNKGPLGLRVTDQSSAVLSDKNDVIMEDISHYGEDTKEDPSTSSTDCLPPEHPACSKVTASPTISKNSETIQENSVDPGTDSVVNDPNTNEVSTQDSADESSTEDEEPVNNDMYPAYPPHPDNTYKCSVSLVYEAFWFSLNILWDEDTYRLYDDMLVGIQADAPNLLPLKEKYLFQNKPCIAIFPKDGLWYRAAVLQYSKRKSMLKVLYVDYGNIEDLPVADAREISVKWLQMPPATMFAKLYGMQLNYEVEFSILAKYYYKFILLTEGVFQINIMDYEGLVPLVELRNENGELVISHTAARWLPPAQSYAVPARTSLRLADMSN
ncbi:tudor domain-containing protein 1-like [Spodoptera litura]|uniref:Tudor domain-containing protein 1-like n=1 Tax=Spodoptera litura TaxID=69820 RepID=A0A9J7J138_SPOLT|nr:tudor domain-containing protein 1-like [Spodoptera litura]